MIYKRGKLPARPGVIELKFGALVVPSALPPLPEAFGHDYFIPDDQWGMLGNGFDASQPPQLRDGCGCCVWSGGNHETMIFNKARGIDVAFNAGNTISDYSAATGYKLGDDTTDQGTDVAAAAEYRRTVGLLDAKGNRHKIAGYMEVDPGNMLHLWYAVYLGMLAGIGWRLPDIADDLFNRRMAWDFTGQPPGPGHYTPFTHHNNAFDYVITWGRRIRVRRGRGGIGSSYCDEGIVYITEESLVNRKSPEGFDYDLVAEYLGSLKRVSS